MTRKVGACPAMTATTMVLPNNALLHLCLFVCLWSTISPAAWSNTDNNNGSHVVVVSGFQPAAAAEPLRRNWSSSITTTTTTTTMRGQRHRRYRTTRKSASSIITGSSTLGGTRGGGGDDTNGLRPQQHEQCRRFVTELRGLPSRIIHDDNNKHGDSGKSHHGRLKLVLAAAAAATGAVVEEEAVVSPTDSTTAIETTTRTARASSLLSLLSPARQRRVLRSINKDDTIARLVRSTAVLVGCVWTWAICRQQIVPLSSAIQALAWTGITASLVANGGCRWWCRRLRNNTKEETNTNTNTIVHHSNPAPLAAAMFCGAFAALSSQVLLDSTASTATVMGITAALVYYIFDANQIGVGVGGRLGLVGFLANVALGTIRRWPSPHNIPGVVLDTVQRLRGGPNSVAALAALAATAWWRQRRQQRFIKRSDGDHRQTHGDGSGGLELLRVDDTMKKRLKTAFKSVTMALLLFRYCGTAVVLSKNGGSTSAAVAAAAAAVFGSLAVTWATVHTSAVVILETATIGVVAPVALLGLLAGTVLPPYLAAASYIGAFIGMTRKPAFTTGRPLVVAQASFLAALVHASGVWTGLGGRLGTVAFVSVLCSLY